MRSNVTNFLASKHHLLGADLTISCTSPQEASLLAKKNSWNLASHSARSGSSSALGMLRNSVKKGVQISPFHHLERNASRLTSSLYWS